MAQAILKNIVDDVKTTLTAGAPNVESRLSDVRIDYWVRAARDEVVADYLMSREPYDNYVMSSYVRNLNTSSLTPTSETIEGLTRYYIVMTRTLFRMLDVPFERQIVDAYWHRSGGKKHVKVRVVSYQELENIKQMSFTSPTENNPVIYSVTDYDLNAADQIKVYIEGPGTNTTSGKLELWGVMSALPHDATIKQTNQIEHFSIAPLHTRLVTNLAVEKGAKELNIPHLMNVVNDGLPMDLEALKQ